MPVVTGVQLYRLHLGRGWAEVHAGGICLRELSVTRREGEGAVKIERPDVIGQGGKPRTAFILSAEVWREVTARVNELWLETDRAIHRGTVLPLIAKWGEGVR